MRQVAVFEGLPRYQCFAQGKEGSGTHCAGGREQGGGADTSNRDFQGIPRTMIIKLSRPWNMVEHVS